jgi:hypothetical protein
VSLFKSRSKGEGFGQLGEWMDVIHEVNRISEGLGLATPFGASSDESGPWWAGGYAEEYEIARVIHQGDTTTIAPKTDKGDLLITLAVKNLGL